MDNNSFNVNGFKSISLLSISDLHASINDLENNEGSMPCSRQPPTPSATPEFRAESLYFIKKIIQLPRKSPSRCFVMKRASSP